MVRPIDLQDNLSKAPLASRVQHVRQSAPETAQRHAGQLAAAQQVVDQSRSMPAEPGDRAELHRDDHAEQDSGRRRQSRQQQAGAGPVPELPATAPDPSHIDIVA